MRKQAEGFDRVVVVTGAGSGLGWTKQYSSEPNTFVVAIVGRIQEEDSLHLLATSSSKIAVITLVMTDYASYNRAAREIAAHTGNRVDILINNAGGLFGAGSMMNGKISDSTPEEWKFTFDVNTISPIFFFLALQPQLVNGHSKKVIAISSFLASSDFHKATDGIYAFTSYSTAKAALNMASLKLHHESISDLKVVRDTNIISYRDDGFIFITLNPGYIYTDLHKTEQARSGAPLTAEASVKRMRAFVDRLKLKHSGNNYSLDGSLDPLVR